MNHDPPKESDWKTFRHLVPELRERWLRARNGELAAILRDEGRTPTEQFWEVEERTAEIARTLRECLDGHNRSKMTWFMVLMWSHGMLTAEDLGGFSDELREWLTTEFPAPAKGSR